MKITIKNQEVDLHYGIRSLMLFENIMNKSFTIENTQDSIVFFYCIIIASNKNLKITFDEFLDTLDEDPNLITEFAEWLADTNKVNKLAEEEIENIEGGEPKKSNA